MVALNRTTGTGLYDSVWEHNSSPSRFRGARLTFTGGPYTWHLKLRDGTIYNFSNGGYYLNSIEDRYGNRLTINRTGAKINRITSQHGRYVDFAYDTQGRIVTLTDAIGRVWTYDYFPVGHVNQNYLKRATYPDHTFEEYSYDSVGRMLTVRDRRGNLMAANEYDTGSVRIKKQTLADGGVYQFALHR